MTTSPELPSHSAVSFERWSLPAALGLYFVLTALLAASQLDRLNPDGVAYLRQAGYWAQGEWTGAVSLYWSPLFPLTMAPLRWWGIDGLLAARCALALHGALLLWATARLLRAWGPVDPTIRGLLLLSLAPAAAGLQIFVVAPDVLVAAVLVWGFSLLPAAAASPRPGPAFAAGLVAGLATWAKAYAFPFGLLHLPLSLWWLRRSAGQRAGPWVLAGLAGLFLAVLPLWTLQSWKNGGPTIGKSGPINHAVVGPPDEIRYHPVVWGVPSAPYINVWEAPDRLPYRFWSPWASAAYFRHQIQLIGQNAVAISRSLVRLDFVGFGVATFTALCALALGLGRGKWPVSVPQARWLTATLLLYVGGYLPIAFEARYLNALALPLLLLAGATLTSLLPRRWALGAAVILAVSVTARWVPVVLQEYRSLPPEYFRGIATELQRAGLRGPFVSSSWYHGIALAYHTDQVHAGFPPDASPEIVATRLREAGVHWIVIFDYPRQPRLPVQDLYPPTRPRALAVVDQEHWQLRADLRVRPDPASPQEIRVLAFERTSSPARSMRQPEDGAGRQRDGVTGSIPQNEGNGVARDQPAGGEQPKSMKPE